MLTIIQGGFYADTSRELRTRIEERMRAGKRSLLLVPEQQTVTAESEYAERLPAAAPPMPSQTVAKKILPSPTLP